MIELKRLKLINWHNFENVTFDCARLTYMIGVNAVGKTTILDAIRYCLTTNRNFNALGNKKSGRTLQGSVHAKQRGENAYRRPGRTVAYIGAEFWDSVKRTNFVIAAPQIRNSMSIPLRLSFQSILSNMVCAKIMATTNKVHDNVAIPNGISVSIVAATKRNCRINRV